MGEGLDGDKAALWHPRTPLSLGWGGLGLRVGAGVGEGLHSQRPYRLVVRASRCGHDNSGSTPREGMYAMTWAKSSRHGCRTAQF